MSHDRGPTPEKDYESETTIDHRRQPRVKVLRPWCHEEIEETFRQEKIDACLASIKARGRFFALLANELQATQAKTAIKFLSQGTQTIGTVTLIDNCLLRALQALEECVQQRPRGKELRTAAARWREAHHRHLEWQKESMAIVPAASTPSLNLPLLFAEAELPILADCVLQCIVDFAGIAEPHETCCASLTMWSEPDAGEANDPNDFTMWSESDLTLNLQTRGPTGWTLVSERKIVKSRVAGVLDCSCSFELFFLQLRTILHACVLQICPGCLNSCAFASDDPKIRLELKGEGNLATLSPWEIDVGVAFCVSDTLRYDFKLLSDDALSSSWSKSHPQVKTFKSLRFLNLQDESRWNFIWSEDFPYAVSHLRRCLHDENTSFAYSEGRYFSNTSSLKLFHGSFA